MSVHPVKHVNAGIPPLEPYFQPERRAKAPIRLRPLSALDRMFAYFGSDLA